MNRRLTAAEENHLRRLVAWIACDIWASPEEEVALYQQLRAKGLPEPNDDGKARLIESYRKAESVPKCIRAAVKALRKALDEAPPAPIQGEATQMRTPRALP